MTLPSVKNYNSYLQLLPSAQLRKLLSSVHITAYQYSQNLTASKTHAKNSKAIFVMVLEAASSNNPSLQPLHRLPFLQNFLMVCHRALKMTNHQKIKEKTTQHLKQRAWFWYHQMNKATMHYTKNRCRNLSIEFCNLYKSLPK